MIHANRKELNCIFRVSSSILSQFLDNRTLFLVSCFLLLAVENQACAAILLVSACPDVRCMLSVTGDSISDDSTRRIPNATDTDRQRH